MKPARELPGRDYQALKLASSDLIEGCGGARRAEQRTRVSHQQLGNYRSADEKHAESYFPIDVVADLEADLVSRGLRPVVTEALADLAGYLLYARPETQVAASDEAALLRIARETTEAVAEGWAAKADGVITAAERRHVRQQVREAIVALIEFEQRWGSAE